MNPQTRQRYIILGSIVLVLLLIVALIFFGIRTIRNRGPNSSGEVEDIVAATPTATATPFPTLTPTPTNTPIPTETPLPTATPLPEPMSFTISGPRTIQGGLPRQVSWTIQATGGEGAATIILDDLGGAMLTGDEAGNVIIARTITDETSNEALVTYGDSFVLSAILDPNVREGVVSFEMRNNLYTEPIFIPWISSDDPEPELWSFEVTLDGEEDEVVFTSLAPEVAPAENENESDQAETEETETVPVVETETEDNDAAPSEQEEGESTNQDPLLENTDEGEEVANPNQAGDFQTFVGENGVALEFPGEWFISESQDGIIDLSVQVINPEVIPIPGDNIFATIFSGPAADYSIREDQEVTPQLIKEILLGNTIPSGEGEGAILLTQTGLEIIEQKELELEDEYLGSITLLKTPDGFESLGSNPYLSIFAVITNGTDVIVMNGYTLASEPERLDTMEQIAISMRLDAP